MREMMLQEFLNNLSQHTTIMTSDQRKIFLEGTSVREFFDIIEGEDETQKGLELF